MFDIGFSGKQLLDNFSVIYHIYLCLEYSIFIIQVTITKMGCTSLVQYSYICIACQKPLSSNQKNYIHECSNKASLKTYKGFTIIPNAKGERKAEIMKEIMKKLTTYELKSERTEQKIYMKKPKGRDKIIYEGVYQTMLISPDQIFELNPIQMKFASFQLKLSWFRHRLEKLRISWQEGAEKIIVNRENLIFSGKDSLKKVDLHKQLKIIFEGEGVDDAGGLLRQWMHLSVKQIFSESFNVFKQCNTKETAYKINPHGNTSLIENSMNILGLIIGKAIFQKIPLGCFLNQTILRYLIGQPIRLRDTFSFDKQLYAGWQWIKKNNGVEDLEKFFTEPSPIEGVQEIQLIPEGSNVKVTDKNKEKYLSLAIKFHCVTIVEHYLDILKNSVNKVIPKQLLYVFQPHDLDSILNGPENIDVQDWRKNTVYEGYTQDDEIIQQYWKIVEQFDEIQLRNLLHYCTGITRVPIHGFAFLESNRGEIKKFNIRKTQYSQQNQYPRAYTCFNRLQLPNYEKTEELFEKMKTIVLKDYSFFGLS